MKHLLLATALGLVVSAPPAEARTQLERLVRHELQDLNIRNVNVAELSTAQLAAIHAAANRPGQQGSKRGVVRSILGGRNTIRGLLNP